MHKLIKILILLLLVTLSFPQTAYSATHINSGDEMQLEAEFSILIDANTGHIIHGVNMLNRAYPASMTKVMTALLLLESGYDMSTPVYHSHDAISSVMPWHSGLAYVDESLTVEQALYAIMLVSANDTSNAIAELLGGSTENFARMMTARAHELGAVNTNFTNSHGLWEEEHYTTAYDMALIMREALTHELFRDIIATQRYAFPPNMDSEEEDIRYNTHNMIFPTSMHFSPDVVGGKTGFTNNSRHTLVSYGRRGDLALISVVMAVDERGGIFTDTQTLMDYGFGQFVPTTIFTADDFVQHLDLVQRSGEGVLVIGNVEIYAASDIEMLIPLGFDIDSITMEVHLPDRIVAPVTENFVVGRLSVVHGNNVLGEVLLLTTNAGHQLSERDLAELFPGGGVAGYAYYTGVADENLLTANLMLNVFLGVAGILVFAFVILRFLQFSRRSRHRSLGKYRGYRGYSGPYRSSARISTRDFKFKYRYK